MSIVRHRADKTNLVFIWLTSPTWDYDQQAYRLTIMAISERFRLARHRYHQVIMAVCGLVRLHLNYSFTLSHEL
jgi:hypothetical protein